MGFLIGLLTVVMVLDCLVLIFLVLIQLPKKDAGAGLAFGGGATDALFGAGSGNVLTKITKYAAGAFFVLAIVLSILQRNYHGRTTTAFEEGLRKASSPATAPMTPPPPPSTKPAVVPGTNMTTVTPSALESTNLPVPIPATPAPATAPNQ